MRLYHAGWVVLVAAQGALGRQTAAPASPGSGKGVEVRLTPVVDGMRLERGGSFPAHLTLGLTPPTGVRKLPEGLRHGLFTEVRLGEREHPVSYGVVLDEPAGENGATPPPRLYVDANGDLDFTNDPACAWKAENYTDHGKSLVRFTGGATIPVAYSDGSRVDTHLTFVRLDAADPRRADSPRLLICYADNGYRGRVEFGGHGYNATLFNENVSGDFRGVDGVNSLVELWLDVNGNGVVDRRGEVFDTRLPFNIGGVTWEVRAMTASGASFAIAPSDRTVPEAPVIHEFKVGERVPAVSAETVEGKALRFPEDFKGKAVLFYFWSVGRSASAAEVDALAALYPRAAGKGVEFVGISLDSDMEQRREGLHGFALEHKLTWPQVWDTKGLRHPVAENLGAEHAGEWVLVSAEGEVAAMGDSLAAGAIGKALEDLSVRK